MRNQHLKLSGHSGRGLYDFSEARSAFLSELQVVESDYLIEFFSKAFGCERKMKNFVWDDNCLSSEDYRCFVIKQ